MVKELETLKGLFFRIYEETSQLHQEMVRGNYDQLEQRLEKRRNLMEQVDQFQKEHSTVKHDQDLKERIRRIIELDAKMKQQLNDHQLGVQDKLRKIKQGRNSKKTYRPNYKQASGYFFDKHN